MTLARAANDTAASQSLLINSAGTAILWLRGGSAPEIEHAVFEQSSDGINYTLLGVGTRTNGGWRLSGVSLPANQLIYLRAHGYAPSGAYSGSRSPVQFVQRFDRLAPQLLNLTVLGNGAYQFSYTDTNALAFTVIATANVAQASSNWTVVGVATNVGGGVYQFADTNASSFVRRFYELRAP